MNPFEQGLLRYLSEDQLKKIQSKKIGIGGAGGLGSNAAIMLARSGFRNFEIIDNDHIDTSNLNRQQYFLDEVGKNKVETLAQRLLSINPGLTVRTHTDQWRSENADQYFKNADFILEAFDQATFKKNFVEYYQEKVSAVVSGNGMAGLLPKTPLQVKKVSNVYLVGDGQTDAALGHPPMAPRVTACAAMMCEVVLDLTLS